MVNCSGYSWWRVIKDNKFLFGCTEKEANKILSLKGEKIRKAFLQSHICEADLCLQLSNGSIIEFFSTSGSNVEFLFQETGLLCGVLNF